MTLAGTEGAEEGELTLWLRFVQSSSACVLWKTGILGKAKAEESQI